MGLGEMGGHRLCTCAIFWWRWCRCTERIMGVLSAVLRQSCTSSSREVSVRTSRVTTTCSTSEKVSYSNLLASWF